MKIINNKFLIHFIGIGGIGMSGIAELMHEIGYTVLGSDKNESENVKRLKKIGIKPNFDIPSKGKYMIKDCKLCAEKDGIEFKFNNYFPIMTLNLMRCVLIAEKNNFSKNFINKVFEAIWKDGLNLNDNSVVEKLLKKLDINPRNFLMESVETKIKEELKKRTEEAYNNGVFGVPSFTINNKIFWGQDRLDFVLNEAIKH